MTIPFAEKEQHIFHAYIYFHNNGQVQPSSSISGSWQQEVLFLRNGLRIPNKTWALEKWALKIKHIFYMLVCTKYKADKPGREN